MVKVKALLAALSSRRSPRSGMKTVISPAHVQIGDVRVYLRRRDVGVPQQRLHRTRIRAMLQQMRRKAMTQGVR